MDCETQSLCTIFILGTEWCWEGQELAGRQGGWAEEVSPFIFVFISACFTSHCTYNNESSSTLVLFVN